ncbi:hypothetical protein K491DRAFT_597183 [Lophiostoma macrostomum CBS 122681]|uniref:DUF7703 domain-containing protein n=1 Tax=Lophiostoma macrostomum CBS 122681 TaxID=1314788 RepID=A0A6A6T8H9_9PLEO|nr:hypothetical protein K491DRAFT_597183 [Lophiostoma macrostomum CBS 122681]
MGSEIDLSYSASLIIVAFITIALYNVAELTVLIQTFFKRHSGWYYYSLLVATLGIFLHALGNIFKFYRVTHSNVANTIVAWLGWVLMVTGQSVVLYSRLHLVVQAPWIRWVLFMIIGNAVVLHTTTGVLTFLTNLTASGSRWKGPYSVMERVQITMFFIQEVILSGIYIWKTTSMLRSEGPLFNAPQNVRGTKGKQVLLHTILINLVIIALEVTLLGLEFSGLYDIQTSYKTAVYSVKLKMEFTILNQLINLVKGNLRSSAIASPYSASKSHGGMRSTGLRSGIRSSVTSKDLGNTAGAYARMDEILEAHAQSDIRMRELKGNDVLKTTTTEVRFEEIEEDGERREKASRRSSDSDLYIIERSKV